MSKQEPEKEDAMLVKVEGSKRRSVKTEPGFEAETAGFHEQTCLVSDQREDAAMLEYDPQQMMFVLQRLKELRDNLSLLHTNLPNMEASIGRNIDAVCEKVADLETQFRDTGSDSKVEEKMRAVDAEMALLSHQLSSLVSEGGLHQDKSSTR
jgi:deoxyribodipyrimidine photolyase